MNCRGTHQTALSSKAPATPKPFHKLLQRQQSNFHDYLKHGTFLAGEEAAILLSPSTATLLSERPCGIHWGWYGWGFCAPWTLFSSQQSPEKALKQLPGQDLLSWSLYWLFCWSLGTKGEFRGTWDRWWSNYILFQRCTVLVHVQKKRKHIPREVSTKSSYSSRSHATSLPSAQQPF